MKSTYRILNLLSLCTFLILLGSCRSSQVPADAAETADTIIHNATIWTGNPENPTAQAMAISGNTILAVGNEEDIHSYRGDGTEVINLDGKFVYPGFIDTHVHLMDAGMSLSSVQLRDASTPEEFAKRIAEYAETLEPGTWILEGNWDHTLWGGELPRKEWIDEYTKEYPVFINRLDGHMALANSRALELAGIDKNTQEVDGGTIVRDEDGNPTGMLKDNAMGLVSRKIPSATKEQTKNALDAAMEYLALKGVTTIHDMNAFRGNGHYYEVYQEAKEAGELSVRIYAVGTLSRWEQLEKRVENEGTGDEWIRIGGLKGFVDGSLGSHTAAFMEPYTDEPDEYGFFINTHEDLRRWISGADKAELQIMVHAIGDSAINSLLNIYEQVASENGEKDRRFRIEHAQHIAPDDMHRFAELDIIASMQPYHAIDDGRWADEIIGDRVKTTYPFNSLFDENAVVAFGSDWAVAPATPLDGIYAAVTRRTLDGENPDGWVPEQKITVEQALKAYTINAAYSSFEEDIKGSLEPGKLADFVVLDENLKEIDPVRIKDVEILETYVGGKKVFGRE